MRLFSLIVILFLFLIIATAAGLCTENSSDTAADILIRAAVTPKENIVVGQRVILQVDVLAPDGWAQVKRVRDFSVEGAQVVRYESQGTRLNETIQGRAFRDQRYELSLFHLQPLFCHHLFLKHDLFRIMMHPILHRPYIKPIQILSFP